MLNEVQPKGNIYRAIKGTEFVEIIENNRQNYRKGFDPAATNGSLFGWLTGVAGAHGKSIVYTARGDVMNAWKKTLTGKTVSMERQVAEGQTIADKIRDTKDKEFKRIDNEGNRE